MNMKACQLLAQLQTTKYYAFYLYVAFELRLRVI
jgi:hypothetical protein